MEAVMSVGLRLPLPAALALLIGIPALAQSPVLQRLHRAIPTDGLVIPPFAVGDVDGDGAVDLVLGSASPWATGKVLRNDGTGAFRGIPGALSSSAWSLAVALGDVDQDGDLDLVEARDGQDSLFLNDGTGRFYDASYRLPLVSDYTVDVHFLDVEGDGDVDILLGRYDGKSRLLLNDGGGAFTDAPGGIIDDSGPTGVLAVGDVDGDLDADVLIGSYNESGAYPPRLALNQGGTFVEVPFPSTLAKGDGAVVLFDVDQDQDLDAVIGLASGSELMLNNGAGVFASAGGLPAPPGIGSFDVVVSFAAADVDGDGDLDLVAGWALGIASSVLYVNDGSGGFTLGAGLPAEAIPTGFVALADVDLDQDPDLIQGHTLALNDGAGAFQSTDELAGDHPALAGAFRIALADADGDGDRDVFAAPGGVFLNERGTLVPSATAPAFTGSIIAVGDLDGDGDVDALDGTFGGAPFGLFLGDGIGGFVDATASLPATGFLKLTDIDLGDLDGDGDLDALGAAWTGGVLLRNTGGAVFVDDSAALPVLGYEIDQMLFDVDNDGDLDLLRGTQHALYRNVGGQLVPDAGALPSPGEAPATVAAGDVDGDGDVDLAWGYGGLAHDRLYANTGGGSFVDATPYGLLPVAEPTTRLLLVDLDGDGALDLYQAHAPGCVPFVDPIWGPYCATVTGGSDRVYRNLGGGQFQLATGMLATHDGATHDVAADDLDGDGDVDVLAAGGGLYAGGGGFLRNTTRQIAWRAVPRIGKPLAMDVYGSPFAPWFLAASVHPASVPLGAFGLLGIDPTTLIVTVAGAFDIDGRATAGFAVPATPPLIGASAYWQGLVGSPLLRFTNVERTTFTDL
jgi:hypothetical protein